MASSTFFSRNAKRRLPVTIWHLLVLQNQQKCREHRDLPEAARGERSASSTSHCHYRCEMLSSIWAEVCRRAFHWTTPIWAALHQWAQKGTLPLSGEEITRIRALREQSANLRTATAGLRTTLGREDCQPALRFSNQYCVPCQLLAGRRGFWRNSATSGVGHTAKETSVLHVLDWDQPWF